MENLNMNTVKHMIISTFMMGILIADIPEDWQINPANYEHYMTVTAVLEVNNTPSTSSSIVLGAFAGDECRGYTYPILVGEQWMYFLMIYANVNSETIEFEVYDVENDMLAPATDALTFASSVPYGMPDEPVLLSTFLDTIMMGDVNFDTTINVLDIVMLVDIIFNGEGWVNNDGNPLSDDQFTAADYNGDLNINVLDIVMIMDVILSQSLNRSIIWYYDNETWQYDEVRGASVSMATLIYNPGYIGIRSDGDIAGIQFEIAGDFDITNSKLPSGWDINHQNGIVLMYSLDGSKLSGNKLFEYSGEINIASTIVADWYGSDILVSATQVPDEYILGKVYPNPFNPITNVIFALPEDGHVSVEIFNLKGQLIDSIFNGFMYAGEYHVSWNAEGLVSGTYFVNMNAGSYQSTQKVVLMK